MINVVSSRQFFNTDSYSDLLRSRFQFMLLLFYDSTYNIDVKHEIAGAKSSIKYVFYKKFDE